MNDRIRELAQEAYTYALIHDNSCHGEVYNKKFAELIVKECLFIIDDERKPDMVNRTELWHQIVEHFGVEE